ncbi:type VI secretion system baseplate subunit TssK [Enterobacter cloacae]|nr:type VI secretion system baseplate subunit TssK [Enterobacter cloacae]
MKIYRPLWNEGALLSPQQFQQQSEWETFRSTGVAALASPFAWGVERAEFDERLLGSGLLQITHLRLWLPDGTLVDAAVSDLPPEPRELGASQLSDVVTVVIALPLRLPEVSVWQEVQAARQHFPAQEAMEAGKMRICLILVQEVRSPGAREDLITREKPMIRY